MLVSSSPCSCHPTPAKGYKPLALLSGNGVGREGTAWPWGSGEGMWDAPGGAGQGGEQEGLSWAHGSEETVLGAGDAHTGQWVALASGGSEGPGRGCSQAGHWIGFLAEIRGHG